MATVEEHRDRQGDCDERRRFRGSRRVRSANQMPDLQFNSAERGAAALRDFPRTLGVLALASDLRCVFRGLTMRTAVFAVGRSHAVAVLVCAFFSAFHSCSPLA